MSVIEGADHFFAGREFVHDPGAGALAAGARVTTHRDAFHPRLTNPAPIVRRPPAFGKDDAHIETDLIVIPTEDRHSWDGMIFRPRHGAVDPRLAVLVIHGSVGNYLTGMPRRLAFHLAQEGYAALTANTRMANYGVFFGTGLIDRAQLDIAAAVRALRERGFRRIILLGYSMGSTMVTHYQAVQRAARGDRRVHHRPPAVAAAVAATALGAVREHPEL